MWRPDGEDDVRSLPFWKPSTKSWGVIASNINFSSIGVVGPLQMGKEVVDCLHRFNELGDRVESSVKYEIRNLGW